MGSTRRTIKKISPLQAIVFTGTISIIIIIAGTAGFVLTQHNLLEKVEKKQACYLDLVEFKGKLTEFNLSRGRQHIVQKGTLEQQQKGEETASMLLLMYEKLLAQMHTAGLQPVVALQAAKTVWQTPFTDKKFEIFRL